jgi:hypothetical protein
MVLTIVFFGKCRVSHEIYVLRYDDPLLAVCVLCLSGSEANRCLALLYFIYSLFMYCFLDYLTTLSQLYRLFSVDWEDDCGMNRKGCRRKQ